MVSKLPRRLTPRGWLSLRLLLFVIGAAHFSMVAPAYADMEDETRWDAEEMLLDTSDPAAEETHEAIVNDEDEARMIAEDEADQVTPPVGAGGLALSNKRWTLSISGGLSYLKSGTTSISSDPAILSFRYQTNQVGLNFPARSYTVDNFDNGYSVLTALTRRIAPWVALGLQGGVSFAHSNNVENGPILFLQFDSMGNLLSSQIITYRVDYQVTIFHAEPILQLGEWFPVGRFAWKPYLSAGSSINEIVQKEVLNTANTDFELSRKSTISYGVLFGGGVDFRFSRAGAVGLQYQVDKMLSNGYQWTLSFPTLRLTYLF